MDNFNNSLGFHVDPCPPGRDGQNTTRKSTLGLTFDVFCGTDLSAYQIYNTGDLSLSDCADKCISLGTPPPAAVAFVYSNTSLCYCKEKEIYGKVATMATSVPGLLLAIAKGNELLLRPEQSLCPYPNLSTITRG